MDIPFILSNIRAGAKWALNGNTYDGLEWLDESIDKPSEEDLAIAWKKIKHDHALQPIRMQRDHLLASSDWTQAADAPVDAKAWAAYRQALRDLPATVKDPTQPIDWPAPPE